MKNYFLFLTGISTYAFLRISSEQLRLFVLSLSVADYFCVQFRSKRA